MQIETARYRSILARAESLHAAMIRAGKAVESARESLLVPRRNLESAIEYSNQPAHFEVQNPKESKDRAIALAQAEVDRAQAELDAAKAEYERAKAEWQAARKLADNVEKYAGHLFRIPGSIPR